MRLLHLSDLHLTAAGDDDAQHALDGLLHDCRHLAGLGLVVVSGDLADDGSPAAYAAARARLEAYADRHGAALISCVGNHDDRDAFAAALGTGHRDRAGRDVGIRAAAARGSLAALSDVNGLRVVTLDALVPGKGYGVLAPSDLAWLAEELSRPAARGTIVVVHQPPVVLDLAWEQALALQGAQALETAIAGSDVRVVLSGHVHHALCGALGATPVLVTPGVADRFDLTAPEDVFRMVHGASATVIELPDDGRPLRSWTLHAASPRAGEVRVELDADAVAAMIREAGPEPA